ncbi:MAG: transposase [Thermodesulfobacteriota bacterium]
MMERHRKSIRLKNYDYSQPGGYFVTICTNSREFYFENLPELKQIVQNQWKGLEKKYLEIELDEFIVMPNHIHGIIFIVGAIHELPLQNRRNMILPKAIGYFKMNTSRQFNQILNRTGQPFWQRNYYEHIIRNERELSRIREYIQNNPLKWELDRENPMSKNFNLDHDTYWKEVYE